jgi:hypothetical protein
MATASNKRLSLRNGHVNWRNIAIALTDTDFGEQKAQSGEKA